MQAEKVTSCPKEIGLHRIIYRGNQEDTAFLLLLVFSSLSRNLPYISALNRCLQKVCGKFPGKSHALEFYYVSQVR